MLDRVTAVAAAAIASVVVAPPSPAHAGPGCPDGYYSDSALHECVRRPVQEPGGSAPPYGATARCNDGSYSFSQHPDDDWTCSDHGGVAQVLTPEKESQ
jgi:hypothetical protein